MQRVLVDSSFLGQRNGISRDAAQIISELNPLFRVIYYPAKRRLFRIERNFRRLNNVLLICLNFRRSTPVSTDEVFYQPHLNSIQPSRTNKKWIIRVHDLFPLTNPEWFNWWAVATFRRNFTFAVRHEASLIFSSEYSRKTFLSMYPTYQGQVAVLPCKQTILEDFMCEQCEGCQFLKNFEGRRNYLLSVGTVEPRKNYEKLIQFADDHARNLNGIDLMLIIGGAGWKSRDLIKRLTKEHNDKIRWISSCCDGALNHFYINAFGFVSMSLDEGFNLPALEARLSYGLPLFLSDIPVHREIHGQHAYYFQDTLGLFLAIELSRSHGILNGSSELQPSRESALRKIFTLD